MAALDTMQLSQAFDLLTHPHRRYVLYYLTEESEVVDIDTLATAITKWERDHTVTDGNNNLKHIKTTLHHGHLPKLADADIITFNANTGSIELIETDVLDWFLADTARIDGYTQAVAND